MVSQRDDPTEPPWLDLVPYLIAAFFVGLLLWILFRHKSQSLALKPSPRIVSERWKRWEPFDE